MNENVSRFPQLGAAPIVEAVIDIRLRPCKPIEVGDLSLLGEKLSNKYHFKAHHHKLQASLVLGDAEGPKQDISDKIVGHSYESEDGNYIVQINPEGMTISRLNGYTTWDELAEEARNVWTCYRETLGEFYVIRTAVRYINKLELPRSGLDFDDYLTAAPIIPKELPQSYIEFFTRNVIPMIEDDACIILTQAFQGDHGSANDKISVILDIDVFSEKEHSSEDDVCFEMLDILRGIKNKAFFSSITPKTLEIYL